MPPKDPTHTCNRCGMHNPSRQAKHRHQKTCCASPVSCSPSTSGSCVAMHRSMPHPSAPGSINGFRHPDTRHLSTRDMVAFCKAFDVVGLARSIWFNPGVPANHSVYCHHPDSEMACMWHKAQWEMDRKEEVARRMLNDAIERMEEFYDDNGALFSPDEGMSFQRRASEWALPGRIPMLVALIESSGDMVRATHPRVSDAVVMSEQHIQEMQERLLLGVL